MMHLQQGCRIRLEFRIIQTKKKKSPDHKMKEVSVNGAVIVVVTKYNKSQLWVLARNIFRW